MKRTGLHLQASQLDGDQPRLPVMDTKGTNKRLQEWLAKRGLAFKSRRMLRRKAA